MALYIKALKGFSVTEKTSLNKTFQMVNRENVDKLTKLELIKGVRRVFLSSIRRQLIWQLEYMMNGEQRSTGLKRKIAPLLFGEINQKGIYKFKAAVLISFGMRHIF